MNEYVSRRRIEKSALDLLHQNTTVTALAHNYRFGDVSSFSRSFKKYFGVSPTRFKKEHPHRLSKIRQLQSKNGQEYPNHEKYICSMNNLKNWITMHAKIEVKHIPAFQLAGLTHIGVNGIGNAFERLTRWAKPKGLLESKDALMGRVFYDSFKVTPPHKVRMCVFLSTNAPFETEEDIQKITLNQGKCIVGRFEIAPFEFEKAWTGLFLWMNENGYRKSEKNPFERYHNDYRSHPENKFIVDLLIPVL